MLIIKRGLLLKFPPNSTFTIATHRSYGVCACSPDRRRLGVEHGSTELEIWAPEPAFGGGSFEAIIPTFAAQFWGISPPSYSIVAGLPYFH